MVRCLAKFDSRLFFSFDRLFLLISCWRDSVSIIQENEFGSNYSCCTSEMGTLHKYICQSQFKSTDLSPSLSIYLSIKWSRILGFNPRYNHTKYSKMVIDASWLNTRYYTVRIKGKVEQSWERISSNWKGTLPVVFTYGQTNTHWER